jgi:hypothetical protein
MALPGAPGARRLEGPGAAWLAQQVIGQRMGTAGGSIVSVPFKTGVPANRYSKQYCFFRKTGRPIEWLSSPILSQQAAVFH